jgi:hypothetical protein
LESRGARPRRTSTQGRAAEITGSRFPDPKSANGASRFGCSMSIRAGGLGHGRSCRWPGLVVSTDARRGILVADVREDAMGDSDSDYEFGSGHDELARLEVHSGPTRPPIRGPGLVPRPAHSVRIGPGRRRRHPGLATPPAANRGGPSQPATPSCRILPERKQAPGPWPTPRQAPPPGVGAGQSPVASGARAAWLPAGHRTRTPPLAPSPSQTGQAPVTRPLRSLGSSRERAPL